MNTLYSSSSTAESLDPQASPTAKARKLPFVHLTINGQVETSVPKTNIVDLAAVDEAALLNPKNPGYTQATSNLTSAFNLYMLATDQTNCTNTTNAQASGGSAGKRVGIITAPVRPTQPAQPSPPCGPQTYDQYISLLQSNQGMNLDTKVEYLSSLLGARLASLYNYNAQGTTSLPSVFQALITGAKTAGKCGDIHTFIAASAKALGLQDAGVTGANWNNGIETGGHAIAQFKDPATGKFIFINYNDAFASSSIYLSEASLQAAQNLNGYSTAVEVQSINSNGKGFVHQMQSQRTQAIQNQIVQGSDMDQSHAAVSLGNEQSTASIQTKLVGSDHARVGVFAVGGANQQGDAVQFGAAGSRADLSTSIKTSQNTQLDTSVTAIAGVLDVHDKSPVDSSLPNAPGASQSRNDFAYFGNGKIETDYSWDKSGNSGKVGAQYHYEEAVTKGSGLADGVIPFSTLTVTAEDDPTRRLQLHFNNVMFFAPSTISSGNHSLHEQDAAVGASYTKQLTPKVTVSTDVTVHDFDNQAVGVQDQSTLTVRTAKRGDFTLSSKVGGLENHSSDVFYNYPLTCSVETDYEKKIGKISVSANGTYNCNTHDDFTLMQGSTDQLTNATPKAQGGVQLHF